MLENYKVDYLLLSAIAQEQADLLALLQNKTEYKLSHLRVIIGEINGRKCCVALTGIGTTNAAAIASALVHELRPQAIFFVGSAGALHPDLKIGDVLLAKQAFEVDVQGLTDKFRDTPYFDALKNPYKNQIAPEIFSADDGLLARAHSVAYDAPVTEVVLASANCFPVPLHYFDVLTKNNVAAIDMESSAIYQVAWLFNIPALIIRSISNRVDDQGNHDTSQQTLATASCNAAKFTEQLLHSL